MSRVSTRNASKRGATQALESDSEASHLANGNTRSVKKKKAPTASNANMFDGVSWGELYEKFILHKKDQLESLVLRIFLQYAEGSLNEKLLSGLIHDVAQQYNQNKYHNFEHAVHVLLNSAYLLTCFKETFLTKIETLSMLYAALIHDVDHYGIPNSTLVNNRHPLAILFHDQSVAENHSLTIGLNHLDHLYPDPPNDCKYHQKFFETIANPSESLSIRSKSKYDLLSSFSYEEKSRFRQNVIELVLNTDIADAYRRKNLYEKLSTYRNNTNNNNNNNSNDKKKNVAYDVSTPASRVYFMSLLLRLADIGGSTQHHETFLIWSENYFLENYEAYEEEQKVNNNNAPLTPASVVSVASGVSSSSWGSKKSNAICSAFYTTSGQFYKNQVGYMESHPSLLLELIESTKIMQLQWMEGIKGSFGQNLNTWKTLGKQIYNQWVTKHKLEEIEEEEEVVVVEVEEVEVTLKK